MALVRVSGLVSWDDLEAWMQAGRDLNPIFVFALVVVLLVIDTFLSVPTVLLSLLAGYYLGAIGGGLAVSLGLMAMGTVAYGLGRLRGDAILMRFERDADKRRETRELFEEKGALLLIFGRAVPMLPETSCVLAGLTRMPLAKFYLAHGLGSVPYGFILAFSGSISAVTDPSAGLWGWLGVSALLAIAWTLFGKKSPP